MRYALPRSEQSCYISRPLRMHLRDEKVDSCSSQVHKLCQASAERILNDFQPNLMIAIGGGGYVPARILRWCPTHAGRLEWELMIS